MFLAPPPLSDQPESPTVDLFYFPKFTATIAGFSQNYMWLYLLVEQPPILPSSTTTANSIEVLFYLLCDWDGGSGALGLGNGRRLIADSLELAY